MRTGLVLEGGASRTYFSCGVLDALLDMGIYTDDLIGVSAGISFGVSYVSRQKERNLQILKNYVSDKRYMGVRHLLNRRNRSLYNLDFVFDAIPNGLVPFDYDVFNSREGSCIAVLTDVEKGEAVYMEMPRDDRQFMALRASCALPLLFQPIEIDGRKYMDGGIADSVPFQYLLDHGCDKVIVLLTRPRDYRKEHEGAEKLIRIACRKYPRLVEKVLSRPERYNEQSEQLCRLEEEGRAFVIAPTDTHGISRTEKKLQILEPFYREGYDYCLGIREKLEAFLNE